MNQKKLVELDYTKIETGYIPTMDITVIFDFKNKESGEIINFYYGKPDEKITLEYWKTREKVGVSNVESI